MPAVEHCCSFLFLSCLRAFRFPLSITPKNHATKTADFGIFGSDTDSLDT